MTRLGIYSSNTEAVARVDDEGLVTAVELGETALVCRFERIFATSQGPLGALATVRIRGDQLELHDLMIYPAESRQPLCVGVREMLHIVRQIEAAAHVRAATRNR